MASSARLIVLAGVLLLSSPHRLLGTTPEKLEQFLQEYLAAQTKVRAFYENVYIRSVVQQKTERLDDWVLVSEPKSQFFEGELHYWASNSRIRLDFIADDGRCDTYVLFPGKPSGWSASRDRNRKTIDSFRLIGNYSAAYSLVRQLGRIPWMAFCFGQGEYLYLEDFLRQPYVEVREIIEEEHEGRRLTRIDFVVSFIQGKPLQGAIWLWRDYAFVVGRAQLIKTQSPEDYCYEWYLDYRLNDNSIPIIRKYRVSARALLLAGDQPLGHSHTEIEIVVQEIRTDVDARVFDPASLGVSRISMYSAWLEWYWHQYEMGTWVYYVQLSLVLLLVGWLIYRRWRRRRAWQTPSQLAQ